MEKSILVNTHLHQHSLEYCGITSGKWYCDTLNVGQNKICLRGHEKNFLQRSHARFMCKSSCNFTLCDLCVEKYRKDKPFKFDEEFSSSLHPHKLVMLKNYETKWYCDNLLQSKFCYRGHSKEFLVRKHNLYKCSKGCNYLICDLCFEKTKTNNESLAPSNSNNAKMPTSSPNQETDPIVAVPFHAHPLKKIISNTSKWYCDALLSSPNKICHRGHTKSFVSRKEYKYVCERCNFTLCDSCADKHNTKDGVVDIMPLELISGEQEIECINYFIDNFVSFSDADKFCLLDQFNLIRDEIEYWRKFKMLRTKELNIMLLQNFGMISKFLPSVEQATDKTVNQLYIFSLEHLIDSLQKITNQIFGM